MTQDTPRRGLVRCGVSARPAGAARAVAVAVALLASALGVSSPAAAQAQPFSDTSEDAFYSDAVNALADGGLFEGTECAPGMLCPGEPIDRKTMAVWTVRALDSQNPAPIANSRFSDVAAGSFHAPFIERMAELGVTKGCGDGTFCPDDTVTRYQMAVFLKRAFDLEPGPDPGFTDVTPDAWYYNDVAALAASAITAGCGNGTFCPSQHTTRPNGHLPRPSHRPRRPATATNTRPDLHRHHRRRRPLLRPANRQHHHMLGLNGLGQADAPDGQYTAITAGGVHSCALRTDNTITCWGADRRARRPIHRHHRRRRHSCALGTDHHRQGRRARRPIHRHHRRLATLAPCRQHHHMLGRATARGWPTRPTANTPPSPPAAATLAPWEPTTPSHAGARLGAGRRARGQYTAITAGPTLAPWESTTPSHALGQVDAPDGQYTAITAAATVAHAPSCALRTDNTITCWGATLGAGRRARRPIHRHHRRRRPLLRPGTDNTITCWGRNSSGQADAPDGQYTAITASWEHSCALGTDNTIACWGWNGSGRADAPDGQYTAITAGGVHSCALGTDNTIACWGSNGSGRADAPDGQYSAITAGGEHSCALGTDNTITCWGDNGLGQADAPDGQYTAITAGGPLLRPANRQHHLMLGQQCGAGRRARRPIHRHHRRRRPLLRLGNRQHHHMLGPQHLGAGRRARRPIHRHHRRRRPLLRLGNRQHRHVLADAA